MAFPYLRVIIPSILSASLLLATQAMAATRVTIPDGTAIPFHLLAAVTTEENHVGDIVPIQTAGDVVVDGFIVVPDASKGECSVSKVEPAGGHGHPGTIEVTCSYIVSADHGRIKLRNTVFTQEGERKHGIATVAGIFTYGIASNAVHGNNASINTTRTLTAHIDGIVHVEATVKGRNDSGMYDK